MITGYAWAAEQDFDVVVCMDGDGQMNPDDLTSLIDPVATGTVDLPKGTGFLQFVGLELLLKTIYCNVR